METKVVQRYGNHFKQDHVTRSSYINWVRENTNWIVSKVGLIVCSIKGSRFPKVRRVMIAIYLLTVRIRVGLAIVKWFYGVFRKILVFKIH